MYNIVCHVLEWIKMINEKKWTVDHVEMAMDMPLNVFKLEYVPIRTAKLLGK